jgi:hypothetical protein
LRPAKIIFTCLSFAYAHAEAAKIIFAGLKLRNNAMKKIGNLLDKRKFARKTNMDQESIFYVFRQIIKEEYGRQGAENIVPIFFKDKKLFIKTTGSTWENEVRLQRKSIIKKVNSRLGGEEISDLAIEQ